MLIKDSFTLHAPRDAVWALLQDVERMGACVPGAEAIARTGEGTYRGTLRIKIGPISAAFNGNVRFVEQTPPEKMVAEVSGEDKGSASLVKATFTGTLASDGDSTRLDYEMDVALRGRLGQFGGAVVQATAKKMTADFAACLGRLISQPVDGS
jgi:carbon monoxide dehydrogenase subunit G